MVVEVEGESPLPPLHEQIRLARERVGLTQDELAVKIGVSKSSVAWWESGKYVPRLPKLRLMEQLLQTEFDATGSRSADVFGSSFATPLVAEAAVAFSMLSTRQQAAVATVLRCFLEEKIGATEVRNRFTKLCAAVHAGQVDVRHTDLKMRNVKRK